jgi:hypothetical protein
MNIHPCSSFRVEVGVDLTFQKLRCQKRMESLSIEDIEKEIAACSMLLGELIFSARKIKTSSRPSFSLVRSAHADQGSAKLCR